MAGAVRGDQFVVRFSNGRDLEATAEGWMELLHGRLDPHGLGRVNAVTDVGVAAAVDRGWIGVEIQNLEFIAS